LFGGQYKQQNFFSLHQFSLLYLKALVSSMPRRLEEVIRRDGHTTKY
jgi:hypothetical protein